MSEERKKKSEAAWKAEEDKELNKSRAFVELTGSGAWYTLLSTCQTS